MESKTEYWHIITRVNPKEKLKKWMKVGNCLTLPSIRNGRVALLDFEQGKDIWLYSVKYLKRLDKDIPQEEKIRRLKLLKEDYAETVKEAQK